MFSILTYHSLDNSGSVISVAPRKFAEQMSVLSSCGFKGLALRDAINHLETKGSWPEKSVVLTFDDGYANFYEAAWPVLQQHGFTATVFVVTNHMGQQNDWAPLPQRMNTLPILTWKQAAELSANSIEIASHTKSHVDLRSLSTSAIEEEMSASRKEIERRVGKPVETFAYPFGETDARTLSCAAKEYKSACTTILKRTSDEPLNSLPRVDMYYVRSERSLRRLVEGKLDRYLDLRRVARGVRHNLTAYRHRDRAGIPTTV